MHVNLIVKRYQTWSKLSKQATWTNSGSSSEVCYQLDQGSVNSTQCNALICLMLNDIQERAADNTNTESQVRRRCHGHDLSHLQLLRAQLRRWDCQTTLSLSFFHSLSLSALVQLMTPRGSYTLIKLINGSLIFLCMCLHTLTQLMLLDSEGEFNEALKSQAKMGIIWNRVLLLLSLDQ